MLELKQKLDFERTKLNTMLEQDDVDVTSESVINQSKVVDVIINQINEFEKNFL